MKLNFFIKKMLLKMQTKYLISLVFVLCLVTQNTFSQSFAIKASVPIVFDYNFQTGYDLGFEANIYKKWTGQVSFTTLKGGGAVYNKQLWAFQIRHYWKNDWTNSAYGGLLVQNHFLNRVFMTETRPNPLEKFDEVEKKWGAGFIIGGQPRIAGRFGLDIHIGLLFQKGTIETAYTHFDPKLDYVKTENTAIKTRLFWGMNLYIALGKMPESKTTNKEAKY
jgi:hypothetical protein